jgi:hypothetical protein
MEFSQRIFGVGLNKTGTTSLKRCFEALGLHPIAPARGPTHQSITRAIFSEGDFEPALRFAEDFRCFEDRPWNVWDMYRRLDERFPGSRFILTVRDPDSWWDSVERWLSVTKPRMTRTYCRHLGVPSVSRESMVESFHAYNRAVTRYFQGRMDLLVLEIGRDGWDRLCTFLGHPVPEIPFPHVNRQSYDERDLYRRLPGKDRGSRKASKARGT